MQKSGALPEANPGPREEVGPGPVSAQASPPSPTSGRSDVDTSFWLDLFEMGKPRLSSLVLFTVLAGILLAWIETGRGHISAIPPLLVFHTLLGVMLAAYGCAALNQLLECESDKKMERTKNRPLPAGRLTRKQVLIYGLLCATLGSLEVTWFAGVLPGALTALTVFLYVVVYTPLKRRTSLNTLVGAITGATPPLIGWAAIEGRLSAGAWILFAILYVWQLPHFFAIALFYKEDYGRAGIRMLSTEDGDGRLTLGQITIFLLTMLPVSLLPYLQGMAGEIYLIVALILGLAFLGFGLYLLQARTRGAARRLFLASILYLPILLGVLVLDAFQLKG